MKPEKRLRKRVVTKTDGRYLIYYERKPAARTQAPPPRETQAEGR